MTKLSCGRKTTSGRMLGCVIFFPRLAQVVNRAVRGGGWSPPPLRCADCAMGRLRGWVAPLYGVWGSASRIFFFAPYIRLGRPTYGFVHDFCTWFWTQWFSVHGFGHYGFRSMVLDASAYINMDCNIGRNIMKNQSGSPSFGIQGKIFVYMCFIYYVLALFISCVLEFVCR